MKSLNNLVWLRRDLRLEDNTALSASLSKGETQLLFIFDDKILSRIKDKEDLRVSFIYDSLRELNEQLKTYGSSLIIKFGDPKEIIPALCLELDITDVYTNRDYESYALNRDQTVTNKLSKSGVNFHSFRDQVIFENLDIIKKDGTPYKVYTPYSKAWKEKAFYEEARFKKFNLHSKNFKKLKSNFPDLFDMTGFTFRENPSVPAGRKVALKVLKSFKKKIDNYHRDRDYPYKDGTSHISPYLRFGLISIRECFELATSEQSQGYLIWQNELIWREFYMMILSHFPQVEKKAFKPKYENLFKEKDKTLIKAWKEGKTGVPIVDAAMRELNLTGTMPNRLRMVTASYFCKILLQDWRIGEAYFAQKLMDFDLSANNGGWQWSSSTGCDAVPYFRIFNPFAQSKKFDKEGSYIRKFCPELSGLSNKMIHRPSDCKPLELEMAGVILGKDYPEEIVDYKLQRDLCLKLFKGV